jgi:four helix bundle protein
MTVKDFRELRVYQMAFQCAMALFNLSKKWPAEERYSLTDQIRRCSRSVCGNIAEAWRKRRYPASFIHKMTDADAEAADNQSDKWCNI